MTSEQEQLGFREDLMDRIYANFSGDRIFVYTTKEKKHCYEILTVKEFRKKYLDKDPRFLML